MATPRSTGVTGGLKAAGQRAGASPWRTAVRLAAYAVGLVAAIALLGLLVTKVFTHDAIGRADAAADRTLARDRTSGWNTVTHWTTDLAETPTVIALGAVLFVVLRLTLRRWRESVFLAVTVVGEVLIFLAVTLLVHRKRPPVPHLDPAPPTSSYPSGHTAASIALYGGLAMVVWRTAARSLLRSATLLAALLVPMAVAFSRVYRGMHFPSDVTAGALLGLVWLSVTTATLLPRAGRLDPRRW